MSVYGPDGALVLFRLFQIAAGRICSILQGVPGCRAYCGNVFEKAYAEIIRGLFKAVDAAKQYDFSRCEKQSAKNGDEEAAAFQYYCGTG